MQEISHTCGFSATNPALWIDHLEPAEGAIKLPLVLVHGGGHTGTCYLLKPDGSPGWAQHFVKLGYPVYVLDWPGMGRSGHVDYSKLTGEFICKTLGGFIETLPEPCALLTHSMSGAYGWRLVQHYGRRIKAVVGVAPAPPGNIQDEPIILEQGKEYIVVQRGDFKRRIDLFKPTPFSDDLILQKLIGDGDKFPRDFLNSYAAGLSGTPPKLAYERGNIAGSQLKITNTGPFTDKPILIVTADHDRDHTYKIDGAIVDWLQEIGAAAEFCYLPDRGISGNGHMMMLEKNSNDIAVVISKWIDSRVSH